MKSSELDQHRQQATSRGMGVMYNYFVEKAENATLWGIGSSKVIGFAVGIAVLDTGHRHPKVVAVAADQLQAFTHTAYQIMPYESHVSPAERINDLAPIDGPAKAAFFTTDTEAVENAVKITHIYANRPGLTTFSGDFHGRISMTMALTDKVAPYKIDFGPFPGSVYYGVCPNEARGMTTADALKSLERIFKADIAPDQVATIILEPIQGEDGLNVTPADFMQALCDLCDTHGILLIIDKVQTGFTRTGKLFAMQHCEVKPDLMAMAKSLAGGFPLSSVVGRTEVMGVPAPGGLGGTYAGSPLTVAATHTVLDVIAKRQLCQRVEQLDSHLQEVLNQARVICLAIVDVHGQESMVTVELNDPQTGGPLPEFTRQIQQEAQENDLLLLSCGVYGNVIRFLYPLTIPDAQFSKALDILARVLKS